MGLTKFERAVRAAESKADDATRLCESAWAHADAMTMRYGVDSPQVKTALETAYAMQDARDAAHAEVRRMLNA